jgi:DNA repair protein RadC
MNERTKNVAWITVLAGTVAMALYGWWRQKRSSIGGYADVKDIEPMTLRSPSKPYPVGPVKGSKKAPKKQASIAKTPAKRKCEPVEIMQEHSSNTQILACHGEPLGVASSARDAYEVIRGQSQLLQEEFVVLAMDSRNNILATSMVYRGLANGVPVSPIDVFRVPIIHGATRMIVAHNHPSGSIEPSSSDVDITHRIRTVGDALGVALLDHLIVGKNNFSSLRDMGILK